MKYKPIRKIKNDAGETSCKKRSFLTLDEAKEAIAYIEETTWVKNLTAYKCDVCGLWHLTRRKG